MSTLSFGNTDKKIFTPISTALSNLPNGAGTIIVLFKLVSGTNWDLAGLTNSAASNWYHAESLTSTSSVSDDDGLNAANTNIATLNTTDWYFLGEDWPAGGAALQRTHIRNQTTLSGWTHTDSGNNNGGNRAGPGTGGWMTCGFFNDFQGVKLEGVVAVWAGIRFANADYGSWTKTSDLYQHAQGPPTFLTELNTTTPVDIGSGAATYSSANSAGTTLTGADPSNWTFDGVGSAAIDAIEPRDDFEPTRIGPF